MTNSKRLNRILRVSYSPELFYSYILSCIIDDKGIPVFKDKLFGAEIGEGEVILACRDMDYEDLLASLHVVDIPKEVYDIIKKTGRRELAEWKEILASIVEEKTLKEIGEVLKGEIKDKDLNKMIEISRNIKTKKVDINVAKEILERIKGPETIYDLKI